MSAGDALTLTDLVSTLKNETGYNDLKKRMESLAKGQPRQQLATPMAKVSEQRGERQAHYKAASEKVTEWDPLVKDHRKAKHISFSAEALKGTRSTVTVAALTDKFSAKTAMEKKVAELLGKTANPPASASKTKNKNKRKKAAYYDSDGGGSSEDDDDDDVHNDLPENTGDRATLEVDAKARLEQQRELARLRSVMQYQEQKRRQMNKIKSRSYRRIRKKQRLKAEEAERDRMRMENPEAAAKLDEDEAAKRARERMTLKHRNKGKWAQRVLRTGGVTNDGHREALNEHVRQRQELMKKMDNVGSDTENEGDDSDDDSDSPSDSDEDEATAGRRRRRKAKAAALNLVKEIEDEADDADTGDAPTKGLFSLKFMRDAATKQREKAKAEAEALVKELDDLEKPWVDTSDEEEEEDDEEDGEGEGLDLKKKKKQQQQKEATKTKKQKKVSTGTVRVVVPGQDEEEEEEEASEEEQQQPANKKTKTKAGKKKSAVAVASVKGKAVSKKSTTGADEDNLLVHATAGSDDDDDGDGAVDDGGWGAAAGLSKKSGKKSKKQKNAKPTKSEQEELVRRAFAGFGADEMELQQEKEEYAAFDLPSLQPTTPSGWGDWAGFGAAPAKPSTTPAQEVERKKEAKALAKKRKDGKKKRVVINEKRDRKASKHLAASVPYPFKSREEYERSLRKPVGREWNTLTGLKEDTKPEIVTKAGLIIDPIKKTKERQTVAPEPSHLKTMRAKVEKAKADGSSKSKGKKRRTKA